MKRKIGYIITPLFCLFVAGTVFADDIDIHGFLAQGFIQSNDNNFLAAETEKGTFEFNEMGINFSTKPTSNLKLGMQLFARDLGEIGNDKIVVDWAFGDYSWREWLGIRIGMLKSPLGLYDETRDIDSLRTAILLPQSVYNELFRDAGQGLKGISIYGNIAMSFAGLLQYELNACDVQIPLDGGTARLIEGSEFFSGVTSIDPMRVFLGSLKWDTPVDGLMIGASGFIVGSTYNVTSTENIPLIYENDLSYFYLSAEYIWNDLSFSSECLMSSSTRNMYLAALPSFKILDDDDAKSTSYYVRASYRFLDWFEAGVYYSEAIDQDDGSGPENELKDIALSNRFDLNEYWTIKLEVHQMSGLAYAEPDEDGNTEDDWILFLAKISFNF